MKRTLIVLLVFAVAVAVGISCAACVCHMAMDHKDNAFHKAMNCCPSNSDCSKGRSFMASYGDVKSVIVEGSRLNFAPLKNLVADTIGSLNSFLRTGNTRGVSPPPFSGHFSSAPIYLQTSSFLI